MYSLLKNLFFPRLYFGIDDLGGGGGDPDEGQPEIVDDGNIDDPDGGGDPSPTDLVDFGEVKVPKEALEAKARELYKDQFEAYENREKWQAANTKRAEQLAEERRLAEEYRQLMADPRFRQTLQPQPTNLKEKFIQSINQKYPDVDRGFLGLMGDFMEQFAGHQAQQLITPYAQMQGQQAEKDFLSRHPDVVKGSDEYYQIVDHVKKGYDVEDAYNKVFYQKNLSAEIEKAMKERDKQNALKLKQRKTSGGKGGQKTASNFDAEFEDVYSELADAS